MKTTIRALAIAFFAIIAISSAKSTENGNALDNLVEEVTKIDNVDNKHDPLNEDGLDMKQGLRGQQRSRMLCTGAVGYCDKGSDCCSGTCLNFGLFHACAA